MRSLMLTFCGILLVGSTAAFLLYVSLLSILSVVLILTSTMFMFLFGVDFEKRRRRVSENPSGQTLRRLHATHTLLDAPGTQA